MSALCSRSSHCFSESQEPSSSPLLQPSTLTTLRVTILDNDGWHDPRPSPLIASDAVRAISQLHSLRVLDIIFNAGYWFFTRHDLLALSALSDLRELGVVSKCLDSQPGHPYYKFDSNSKHVIGPHTGTNMVTDAVLLAFAATRPQLRRLEIVVPLGHSAHISDNTDWYDCSGSGSSSCLCGTFLLLLAERCPRLEVLRLAGLCALEALEHARDEPAFPVLRLLHVYSSDHFYHQAKPRYV